MHGQDDQRGNVPNCSPVAGEECNLHIIVKSRGRERFELKRYNFDLGPCYHAVIAMATGSVSISAQGGCTIWLSGDVDGISTGFFDREGDTPAIGSGTSDRSIRTTVGSPDITYNGVLHED